ncbi:hypothetical protein [Mycobacteroides abscessus]|uniref:hypothetical protein n=1 Tax=Mycobacteroides abscessus TaxID=36809 RepID=UPI00092A2FD1|nr:hypothetical protein [Mycobacteroides abscessus]SIC20245.1 Uncharacterised protein [Mycobacteroides abscessus subsp. abscessus]
MTTILPTLGTRDWTLIAALAAAALTLAIGSLYRGIGAAGTVAAEPTDQPRRPKLFIVRGALVGVSMLVLLWAIARGFGVTAAVAAALVLCLPAAVVAVLGSARTYDGLHISRTENDRASAALVVAGFSYFLGWMIWTLSDGLTWPLPITLAIVFWVGLGLAIYADRRGRQRHLQERFTTEQDRQ